jgi:hypothetical protein
MPDDRPVPEMLTSLNLAALVNQAKADTMPDALEVRGKVIRPDTLSAYWEGGTE